jgi:hypothetical protein
MAPSLDPVGVSIEESHLEKLPQEKSTRGVLVLVTEAACGDISPMERRAEIG